MGVSEDLDLIENLTRQLQTAWDKFFSGVERKPPHEMKDKLEALIRRYAYQEMNNNTERFRYQSLSTRYSTFAELWNKRLRAMEEGRVAGLHVTAGMAHSMHLPAAAAGLAPTGFPVAAVTANSAPVAPPAKPAAPARAAVGDKSAARVLFEQFVAARRATGESAPVSQESFEKLIEKQTARILSEKGGSAVEFRVETKDGKVSLKARPVR